MPPKSSPPVLPIDMGPSVSLKDGDIKLSKLTLGKRSRDPIEILSDGGPSQVPPIALGGSGATRAVAWDSLRKEERGTIKTPTRINVWIQSERFPLWLIALDPSFISHVWIMGTESFQAWSEDLVSLRLDADLVEAALENLGRQQYTFTMRDTPPDGAIFLVSGSLEFVSGWIVKTTNPLLVLCDEHIRSRKIKPNGKLR